MDRDVVGGEIPPAPSLCGLTLVPQRFLLDRELVDSYILGVGDEGYGAFAAAVAWREGRSIAPLTIFDRYMSTYLVGNGALAGRLPPFGVHAKQQWAFHAELLVGHEYELRARVRDVQARRNREYLSIDCDCVDVVEPDRVLVEAVFTRAQSFEGQQYQRTQAGDQPSLAWWLAEVGATGASFPSSGAVVEGRSRQITQERLDLFLGPGPNFHTDAALARRLGFPSTVAAGVMATELECELYRELFGLTVFRTAQMEVNYVAPIPQGATLRPVCVVQSADADAVVLRTTVCDDSGVAVTFSRVRVGAR